MNKQKTINYITQIVLLFFIISLPLICCYNPDPGAERIQNELVHTIRKIDLLETFSTETLTESRWKKTGKNDFYESFIDIRQVQDKQKLRLAANTMETNPENVKSLGIRWKKPIDVSKEKIITFELDWNNQVNGSYLSAGLFLCPRVSENPRDEENWLAFEYIGVPPGENARFALSKKIAGRYIPLFTEGWPTEQREGRKISIPRVEIIISEKTLLIYENKKLLYSNNNTNIPFKKVFLYLQMNSHSNYPLRTVYFDDVMIGS